MKREKWVEKAEEWERKARMAFEVGDLRRAQWCQARAKSCRFNANYGAEETDDDNQKLTDRSSSKN